MDAGRYCMNEGSGMWVVRQREDNIRALGVRLQENFAIFKNGSRTHALIVDKV